LSGALSILQVLGASTVLYFLSNTAMNAERYENVLQDHLILFMEFSHTNDFLQDAMQRQASK
jgi:hypothetical protein